MDPTSAVLTLVADAKNAESRGFSQSAITKLLEAQRFLLSRAEYVTKETLCQLLSTVLNNLGCIYRHKGMMHEALECLERAYSAELESQSVNATTMLNLCAACSGIGQHDRAIVLAKCTLQTLEKDDPPDDAKKAAAYHNLAMETLHVLCSAKQQGNVAELQEVMNLCHKAQMYSSRAFGADSETTSHIRLCAKSVTTLLHKANKDGGKSQQPLNITINIQSHKQRVQKGRQVVAHVLPKAPPRRLPSLHNQHSEYDDESSPRGVYATNSNSPVKTTTVKPAPAPLGVLKPIQKQQQQPQQHQQQPPIVRKPQPPAAPPPRYVKAAVKIQSWFRGLIARRRVRVARQIKRDEFVNLSKYWCAVLIQSAYRGHKCRKAIIAKQKIKK
eukprot:PhF_6_TR26311/c2_g1_i2/m.37783